MNLDIGVLVDAVNISQEGKLNLLGLFGRVYSDSMPCTLPQMYIVLKFIASASEKGTSQVVKIVLIDDDGKRLMESPESSILIPEESPDLNPEVNFITQLSSITFPQLGTYSFHVMVNNSTVKQIPLIVQSITPTS